MSATPGQRPVVLPDYKAADILSAFVWGIFGALLAGSALLDDFNPVPEFKDAGGPWAMGAAGAALIIAAAARVSSMVPQKYADRRFVLRMIGESCAVFGLGEVAALAMQDTHGPVDMGLVVLGAGFAIVALARFFSTLQTLKQIRRG